MSNKLIIFSAPSGSGKTTVVRHLLDKIDRLAFSVSVTTRQKRPNEENGRDYYFYSENEFLKAIKNEEFLEYEEVYKGLFYGTLKSEVERLWAEGKTVIFDVDVVGGLNIKKFYGDQEWSNALVLKTKHIHINYVFDNIPQCELICYYLSIKMRLNG